MGEPSRVRRFICKRQRRRRRRGRPSEPHRKPILAGRANGRGRRGVSVRDNPPWEAYSFLPPAPINRYNKYTQVAARAIRSGLKETERVGAEKRGEITLKKQKWQAGQAGESVRPPPSPPPSSLLGWRAPLLRSRRVGGGVVGPLAVRPLRSSQKRLRRPPCNPLLPRPDASGGGRSFSFDVGPGEGSRRAGGRAVVSRDGAEGGRRERGGGRSLRLKRTSSRACLLEDRGRSRREGKSRGREQKRGRQGGNPGLVRWLTKEIVH